jgi:hypothetical protein
MRMGFAKNHWTALLPFFALLSAATAHADGGLALAWEAPAECPSAIEIENEISGLLGGSIRDRVHFDLVVHAVVEHDEDWSVSLDTTSHGGEGHRSFHAETCQALASATALIVALMIDPDAVAAHADEPARPPVPALPPPAPPPTPRRPLTGFVGLDGLGNLGVLPSVDVAVGASAGIARSWWRLDLRGGYGTRAVASDRVSNAAGPYGRFRLVSGTLAVCLTRSGSRIGGGVCADVEAGAVLAEGVGASRNESHTRLWLGAGAGAMGDVRVTRAVFVVAHMDAIAPILRPKYTFNNVDAPIFRPWLVGFRLSAALEWRF